MNYLTETKLQEIIDAQLAEGEHPPTIMVGKKQLALLKAKYPEIYDKPYKCSWQRMGEELGVNESGEK